MMDDSPKHLMPIVEFPNEEGSGSAPSTARSGEDNEPEADQDDEYASDFTGSEDEHDEAPISSRHTSSSRKKKKHGKNGLQKIDMTPPDKLLRKAEKKAKRYAEKKKEDPAMKELIKCTALARIVYGDGHWRLARAYANLARGYLDLKGYAQQAQYHSDFAKTIMMGGVQMSNTTEKDKIMTALINVYYTLGWALTQLKKYNEGEQALLKAEKIAHERAKLPSVSDDDIDEWDILIYMALGRHYGRQQKYAMAVTYFDKALDVMQKKYGDDGLELIPLFQSLGKLEQSKGKHADHEKAVDYYLQAHSIASANYKHGSVEVADTAHALAMAYSNVGIEDAETSAESYLNECLAVYQTVHGPYHEKTIEVQDDLSRLMIRTDRHEEAISLLKSTFEAKKEVYGDLSSEVAETWKLIGSVHLAQGESEKALKALKKCHNMECLVHGSNSKKAKETDRTVELLLANPRIAAKHKKSPAEELKERPRFSSAASRGTQLGGCKSAAY